MAPKLVPETVTVVVGGPTDEESETAGAARAAPPSMAEPANNRPARVVTNGNDDRKIFMGLPDWYFLVKVPWA